MIKTIVNNTSDQSLMSALDAMAQNEKVQSIILYIGEHFNFDPDLLSQQLKSIQKTVIGGVFPEVIMNGRRKGDSAILLGMSIPMSYVVIKDLDENILMNEMAMKFKEEIVERSTFFIFVDALMRDKNVLFDSIYNNFGSIPNYVGGGTGTLKFEPTPCVVTNEGILQGVALVASVAQKIKIGVAHGWSAISRQMKVTESSNNEIISLDWKPVMDVYQEVVERHSQKRFDYDDFFNCVKSYPIGIKKLNNIMTVRDPFKTEDGRLFLLDDIEEGSYIQILYGDLDTLIEGAAVARKKAEDESVEQGNTLIIDCISRSLFMGEEFTKELQELDPMSNSFGALTLGEIANNGDEYLDIFNKTAVVGIFE